MLGQLALIVAALFTGAAFYINYAEQPARLTLDDRALLAEWKPAYDRGYTMQATLVIIGAILGLVSFLETQEWLTLVGAVVLAANWPFTLLVIMPTNKELKATAPDQAGPHTRELILKWGKLHTVRTALGAVATLFFLWALN